MADRPAAPPPPLRPKAALLRRYRIGGAACAVAAAAVGALVLVGWAADSDVLKRVAPGLTAMNPATAIAFLVAGTALALRFVVRPTPAWATIALWAGGAILVLIGGTRLIAYAAAVDLGLDRLLFGDAVARETPTNRMAPNTATAFALTGAALLALDRGRRSGMAAAGCALLALLVGLVTLTGYAFGQPEFARVSDAIPMALNTAFAQVATSLAILLAQPEQGLTRSLVLDAEGGRVARRLLPAALLLPPVLAWIGMRGQAWGVLAPRDAVLVMVALGVVIAIALILWTAETLIRAEGFRSRVEQREARLQQALRHRASQIEAANSELEAFSYSVSHDLRAPLRSIIGFSQALLEDHADRLDDQGRDYLDRVVRAGQRMAGLIDDLLRLSRVARADMQRTDVDLSELAQEIVAQIRLAEPGRAVDVVVDEGLHAFGDRQLLQVALDNLIQNAWKYTSLTAAPRIEVRGDGRTPEGAAIFYVRDNGAGFDMAHAHKLFSPFQRLHSEAEFTGSGIGLATVRRVIRRHGGRTWAEAEPGRGAKFFFTLESPAEAHSA